MERKSTGGTKEMVTVCDECFKKHEDEINRRIYNYLLNQEMIIKERTTKKKKEDLYEELDELLLRINE